MRQNRAFMHLHVFLEIHIVAKNRMIDDTPIRDMTRWPKVASSQLDIRSFLFFVFCFLFFFIIPKFKKKKTKNEKREKIHFNILWVV